MPKIVIERLRPYKVRILNSNLSIVNDAYSIIFKTYKKKRNDKYVLQIKVFKRENNVKKYVTTILKRSDEPFDLKKLKEMLANYEIPNGFEELEDYLNFTT